jgi:prevent-host-death family protein
MELKTNVGIRDLNAHLSEVMQQVKSGQSILISEHGKPVGRINPVAILLEDRLDVLCKDGLVEWSGKKLRDMDPPVKNRGDKLASDIVVKLHDPGP